MTQQDDRLVGGETPERADNALRPLRLAEFIGQGGGRANLETFIAAAADRSEAMDHALLHGPPGLGKTTLAQIVAAELGVGFRATSGPVIARAGDLAELLTNLRPRDVLFIDPAKPHVVHMARTEEGWLRRDLSEGTVTLTALPDLQLTFDEIYADLDDVPAD